MHCRGILNFNCDAFNPTLCALITEALLLCLLVSFTYLLIYPPAGFTLSTNLFDQFVNLLFYCHSEYTVIKFQYNIPVNLSRNCKQIVFSSDLSRLKWN